MHEQKITLGSNLYPAKGEDARRINAALDSWRDLPGVDLVNLQFASAPELTEVAGFRSVAGLRQDSVRLTGIAGRRKPVASEVFDVLAREAISAGNALFAFSNTDIVISPDMIATALAGAAAGYKAQMFSRMDFDGATGADRTMLYAGQDAFVLDAAWWMENRRRFRPYIVGEPWWDNAYTAILMYHAPAMFYHHAALMRHEFHATVWRDSPFAPYNLSLLFADSYYFINWYHYRVKVEELRAQNAGDAQELALQKVAFMVRPTLREQCIYRAHDLKGFVRQWLAGIACGRLRPPPRRSVYQR